MTQAISPGKPRGVVSATPSESQRLSPVVGHRCDHFKTCGREYDENELLSRIFLHVTIRSSAGEVLAGASFQLSKVVQRLFDMGKGCVDGRGR
jgi:hypothetical protein